MIFSNHRQCTDVAIVMNCPKFFNFSLVTNIVKAHSTIEQSLHRRENSTSLRTTTEKLYRIQTKNGMTHKNSHVE